MINGKVVGTTQNEFRSYSFEVPRTLLNAGVDANEITVVLHSPAQYCLERNEYYEKKFGYTVPASQYVNSERYWNQIRKAGCSFGWDAIEMFSIN